MFYLTFDIFLIYILHAVVVQVFQEFFFIEGNGATLHPSDAHVPSIRIRCLRSAPSIGRRCHNSNPSPAPRRARRGRAPQVVHHTPEVGGSQPSGEVRRRPSYSKAKTKDSRVTPHISGCYKKNFKGVIHQVKMYLASEYGVYVQHLVSDDDATIRTRLQHPGEHDEGKLPSST